MDRKQNNEDPYNSDIKITEYSGGSSWKKNFL